jgi:lysophospholipase L1-like esterase
MYFSQLPVAKKSIIFFGDSITQWGDLGELLDFTKVLNRGIAGDNTFGLAARVNEVTRHHPKKVFILIGTNDINKKIPTEYIITNYIKIIQSIKQQSQHTKIYVQSVFPINNQLIGRQYYTGTNEQIQQLNKALKQMAVSQGVTYVDVYSQLLDEKKEEMEKALTYDGLHLSGLGYRQWINVLKKQKLL